MRSILLILFAILLCVGPAVAEKPDGASRIEPGWLIAESIRTYEQVEAVRSEMNEAVGDLDEAKRIYELAIRELARGAKTQDQLDELTASIERERSSLKQYEQNGHSQSAIDYSKRRIRELALIKEAGESATDAQRDAFRRKYQPKIDDLNKQILAIREPYEKQIKAIQKPADTHNEQLAELLRPYFKAPVARYPGSTVGQVNATLHMAFGAGAWNDSDDEQIAWAHIRIRSLDEIEDFHRENLLDGTYPIQSLSDNSLWVWAGHFLITFVADDETLQDKETIQQAIHDFVDLEGLASISAEAAPGTVKASAD